MNKPEKMKCNHHRNPIGIGESCNCFEVTIHNQVCDNFDKYYDYLLSKIPSDKKINESPSPYYARAYCQGKFDILMDLKNKE